MEDGSPSNELVLHDKIILNQLLGRDVNIMSSLFEDLFCLSIQCSLHLLELLVSVGLVLHFVVINVLLPASFSITTAAYVLACLDSNHVQQLDEILLPCVEYFGGDDIFLGPLVLLETFVYHFVFHNSVMQIFGASQSKQKLVLVIDHQLETLDHFWHFFGLVNDFADRVQIDMLIFTILVNCFKSTLSSIFLSQHGTAVVLQEIMLCLSLLYHQGHVGLLEIVV